MVVSLPGTLSNTEQRFSLLLDGAADVPPPSPPLTLSAISPSSALPGVVNFTLSGGGFDAASQVMLRRSGAADVIATALQVSASSLTGTFNLPGVGSALWDVVVSKPSGESATLPAAFTVTAAIWSENFDGAVSGWASAASTGINTWSLDSTLSHSSQRSYFAHGTAGKSTVALLSPSITVPAGVSGLQFRFWHRYDFQAGRDGGRIEFSVDGGAWFSAAATNSGTQFASNGYTATIRASGNPSSLSDFAGLAAWSGSISGFIETVINLIDTAKFSGKALRIRWILATDSSTASAGWRIDSVALMGGVTVNAPPEITQPASAAMTETITDTDGTAFVVVRGRQVALSVSAQDDGGSAQLRYEWSAVTSSPVAPGFTANGTVDSSSTVAVFEVAGDYFITVSVRDSVGLTSVSRVNVRILPTADLLTTSPEAISVPVGASQEFAAILRDQFGVPRATQPTSFGWVASGGGTISQAGYFAATAAGGPFAITATSGDFSAVAYATVNRAAAMVYIGDLLQTYDRTPKAVSIQTEPPGLSVVVSYGGTSSPPIAAGSYAVSATIDEITYQGSSTGTLVVRTGYTAWAESMGLLGEASAPEADFVNDGTANFLEYAFGTEPAKPDVIPVHITFSRGVLSIGFPWIPDPGLIYTVDETVNLSMGPWVTLQVDGNPSTANSANAGDALIIDPRPLDAIKAKVYRVRVGY